MLGAGASWAVEDTDVRGPRVLPTLLGSVVRGGDNALDGGSRSVIVD
jgi:hypothetical protein